RHGATRLPSFFRTFLSGKGVRSRPSRRNRPVVAAAAFGAGTISARPARRGHSCRRQTSPGTGLATLDGTHRTTTRGTRNLEASEANRSPLVASTAINRRIGFAQEGARAPSDGKIGEQ